MACKGAPQAPGPDSEHRRKAILNSRLHAMNIHPSQAPITHVAQQPVRPPQADPAQEIARPIQPPPQAEAATQQRRHQQDREGNAADDQDPRRQGREFSEAERREVAQLKNRDREVRQHEAAHRNAAGQHARGGARFSYQTGPDGKRYTVGGEVAIDTRAVPNDPHTTLNKAHTVRRAALAPAEPSPQDHKVALQAAKLEQQALQELAQNRTESTPSVTDADDTRSQSGKGMGRLLDVFA